MNFEPLPQAVCFFLVNKDRKILCISRKKDPSKVGLVGGSVDPGETLTQAVIRETKEECGLLIEDPIPIFSRMCGKYICTTFISSKISGDLLNQEGEGILCFLDAEEFLNKSEFSYYNRLMLQRLCWDFDCGKQQSPYTR